MPSTGDVQRRIEKLRAEINRHNYLYFVKAAPEISDREFDALMEELQRLEREHPELITPDSPTQRVGGEPLDAFASAPHLSPMMSIDNTYNEQEVREFDARIGRLLGEGARWSYVVEPKIDGVAVNLIYRDGVLSQAITRGNGVLGDDVTRNARTVHDIPLRLHDGQADSAGSVVEVRGEIYMSFPVFERVNREREKAGEPLFANPRNSTAGSLKLLDSRVTASRHLRAFTYEVGQHEGPLEVPGSHWERLHWLADRGFPTNPQAAACADVEAVLKRCDYWQDNLHKLGYPADGLVIKVDSVEQRELLGRTSKSPRWMIAYKFAAEQQVSQVREIEVDVGKSGQLTPVAVMEPVQLAGTTVKRASLHNFDELERKDVRVGDYVLVEKAGEIIPQVIKVIEEKRSGKEPKSAPPTTCPACHSPVRREDSDKKKCLNPDCDGASNLKTREYLPIEEDECEVCGNPVRVPGRKTAHKVCDDPACPARQQEKLREYLPPQRDKCSDCGGPVTVAFFLYCDSPACPEQRIQRITHFASRGAMDIEGLGEAAVQMLVEKGFVEGIADLYRLNQRREDIESIEGFGPKSVENLLEGIEQSKARELSRLLFAVGIPNVGSHLAGILAAKFGSLEELRRAKPKDLQTRGEIGTKIANAICSFLGLQSTQSLLADLAAAGVNVGSRPEPTRERGALAGKTFALTGKLERYSRQEATRLIESQGGLVADVSRKTDFLVAGDKPGSKLDKARELGVAVLSEQDFERLIGGGRP